MKNKIERPKQEEVRLSDKEFEALPFCKYPVPFYDKSIREWKCLITTTGKNFIWWKGFYEENGQVNYAKITSHIYKKPERYVVKKIPRFVDIFPDEKECYMNLANEYLSSEIINTHTLSDFLYQVVIRSKAIKPKINLN